LPTTPAAATTWYVNDTSTVGDVWCSVIGSDAANGQTTATPKLTLAAVMALWAAGDTVYVDSGVYPGAFTVNQNNVWIIGAGIGKTFMRTTVATTSHTVTISGMQNVTLRNFTIDDGNASYHAINATNSSDLTLRDLRLRTRRIGINTTACTGVVVYNNVFETLTVSAATAQLGDNLLYDSNYLHYGPGFNLNNSLGVRITNNLFDSIRDSAAVALMTVDSATVANNRVTTSVLNLTGGPATAAMVYARNAASNLRIYNNRMTAVTANSGLNAAYCANTVFDSNSMVNAGGAANTLWDLNYCTQAVVTNNYGYNGGYLRPANCIGALVNDNTLDSAWMLQVNSNNAQVRRNRVLNSATGGRLTVQGSGMLVDSNTVITTFNTGLSNAMMVSTARGCTVTNNLVSGCGNSSYLVYLNDVDSSYIAGNWFGQASSYAMYMDGCSGDRLYNNTIDSALSGCQLTATCNNINIDSHSFCPPTSAGGWDVYLNGADSIACENWNVSGRGVGQYAIYMNGTESTTVRNCRFYNYGAALYCVGVSTGALAYNNVCDSITAALNLNNYAIADSNYLSRINTNGITIANGVCRNNVISGVKNTAIYADTSSVYNNTLTGAAVG
ncbi:MAG TPA: right-handed parallel beta-helix repeat-containing protein, partial [bacterium]|nr:right-handed parallel beta-helix repeat-containing protein [bacterium]